MSSEAILSFFNANVCKYLILRILDSYNAIYEISFSKRKEPAILVQKYLKCYFNYILVKIHVLTTDRHYSITTVRMLKVVLEFIYKSKLLTETL